MKTWKFAFVAVSLIIFGVGFTHSQSATQRAAGPDVPVKADNSAVNERDRLEQRLTADQQNFADTDSELSRKIRKNIMQHKELSTYAQNVKIITQNGSVTLRGPVRSLSEMNTVNGIAVKLSGVARVTNEMEIASGE